MQPPSFVELHERFAQAVRPSARSATALSRPALGTNLSSNIQKADSIRSVGTIHKGIHNDASKYEWACSLSGLPKCADRARVHDRVSAIVEAAEQRQEERKKRIQLLSQAAEARSRHILALRAAESARSDILDVGSNPIFVADAERLAESEQRRAEILAQDAAKLEANANAPLPLDEELQRASALLSDVVENHDDILTRGCSLFPPDLRELIRSLPRPAVDSDVDCDGAESNVDGVISRGLEHMRGKLEALRSRLGNEAEALSGPPAGGDRAVTTLTREIEEDHATMEEQGELLAAMGDQEVALAQFNATFINEFRTWIEDSAFMPRTKHCSASGSGNSNHVGAPLVGIGPKVIAAAQRFAQLEKVLHAVTEAHESHLRMRKPIEYNGDGGTSESTEEQEEKRKTGGALSRLNYLRDNV